MYDSKRTISPGCHALQLSLLAIGWVPLMFSGGVAAEESQPAQPRADAPQELTHSTDSLILPSPTTILSAAPENAVIPFNQASVAPVVEAVNGTPPRPSLVSQLTVQHPLEKANTARTLSEAAWSSEPLTLDNTTVTPASTSPFAPGPSPDHDLDLESAESAINEALGGWLETDVLGATTLSDPDFRPSVEQSDSSMSSPDTSMSRGIPVAPPEPLSLEQIDVLEEFSTPRTLEEAGWSADPLQLQIPPASPPPPLQSSATSPSSPPLPGLIASLETDGYSSLLAAAPTHPLMVGFTPPPPLALASNLLTVDPELLAHPGNQRPLKYDPVTQRILAVTPVGGPDESGDNGLEIASQPPSFAGQSLLFADTEDSQADRSTLQEVVNLIQTVMDSFLIFGT